MMVRTFVPPPYMADPRTPIQKLFGDPPPERSALAADKATWTAWEKSQRRPIGLIDVKFRDGTTARCVLPRDQNWAEVVAYRLVDVGRGGAT